MSTVQSEVKTAVAKAANVAPQIPVNLLNDSDRKFAWEQVSGAYDAYVRKGGIADKTRELEELTEKTYKQRMLHLAVHAVKIAARIAAPNPPNMKVAKQAFKEECDYGEEQLRNAHADPNTGALAPIAQLLPSWPTYKSAIGVSFDFGIDPTETDKNSGVPKYPNASKLIEAGRTAKAAAEQGQNGSNESAGSVIEIDVDTLSPDLKKVMVALSQTVHELPEALHAEATMVLAHTLNSIATMLADFQQKELARREEGIEKVWAGNRPVAVATTGNADDDAKAAARIAEENANTAPATPRKAGKRK